MESIEEFEIKNILVAVDTSDYSEMVIARASAIALAFSADVHVISVVELPKMVASEAEIGIQEVRIQEEDYRENQKRLMDRYLVERELHIVAKVLHGEPADKIVEYANSIRADLIVMGSKALGKVHRFLLGSVSEDVARNAKCSVMIAR
jgi:nucleotide-binding universal stress UspA family protein